MGRIIYHEGVPCDPDHPERPAIEEDSSRHPEEIALEQAEEFYSEKREREIFPETENEGDEDETKKKEEDIRNKSLTERLNYIGNDQETTRRVYSALRHPHINPRDPQNWRRLGYSKTDIANIVSNGVKASNENFSGAVQTVNKDPLKRVQYGILSTGQMPEEFFDILTDWEKTYFFRGRWSNRNPDLESSAPALLISHMYDGVNKTHQDHYVRKSDGQYSREEFKFPESDKIRDTYDKIVGKKNKTR